MSHQTYDPYILWGLYGDLPVVKYDVTVGQGHVLSKVATHTPWCLYGDLYAVIFAITAGQGIVTLRWQPTNLAVYEPKLYV